MMEKSELNITALRLCGEKVTVINIEIPVTFVTFL
jgi:hypothetical protein